MFSIDPVERLSMTWTSSPRAEERLREVAPHEPRAAGDERLHWSMSSLIVSSAWMGRAARRPMTRCASAGESPRSKRSSVRLKLSISAVRTSPRPMREAATMERPRAPACGARGLGVAPRPLGLAQQLHHPVEVLRREGGRPVAALAAAVEGEALLDEVGPVGGGEGGHEEGEGRAAVRGVEEADRHAESLPERPELDEAQLLGGGGGGRRSHDERGRAARRVEGLAHARLVARRRADEERAPGRGEAP